MTAARELLRFVMGPEHVARFAGQSERQGGTHHLPTCVSTQVSSESHPGGMRRRKFFTTKKKVQLTGKFSDGIFFGLGITHGPRG